MADGSLQGWSEDPFGLHEARYFSAGTPTKLVRDGRLESFDEPPSAAPPSGTYVPENALAGSAGVVPGLAGTSGFSPNGFSPISPSLNGSGPGSSAGGGERGLAPRRSHKGLVAAAAVVAVAAVTAGIVIVARSGPRHDTHQLTISSAAFVTRSAQHTLAEHTAQMNMSGTVQAGGQSVALSGTGEVDFATNTMEFSLTSTLSGRSLAEKEILIDGNLYLSISVDGKSMAAVTGGRNWIKMPSQESGTASLLGSDPLSSLAVLEQHGDSVQSLGTKSIGGVTCTGYAVTPSMHAMVAAAKKEFAKLGVSPAMTKFMLGQVQSMTPPTVTVWLNQQELVRQMSLSLQMNGLGAAMSASAVIDFTHFGTPVTIKAPAPSDTISYSSFLRVAGRDLTF